MFQPENRLCYKDGTELRSCLVGTTGKLDEPSANENGEIEPVLANTTSALINRNAKSSCIRERGCI